jgi:hypothetical protein
VFVINHKLLDRNLVQALLGCVSMRDRKGREDIVARLPALLRDNIHRRDANLSDVSNIVHTCAYYSNGLEELIEAVAYYEQQSIPMTDVLRAWSYIQQISGLADSRLLDLLERIEVAHINEPAFKKILSGLRSEFSAIPAMPLDPLWSVVLALWDLPPQPRALQPIQVFVEHLAFHVDRFSHQSDLAKALKAWNDQNAVGFNATSEDLLCRRECIQAGQDYVMTGDLLSLMVVLKPELNNTARAKRFEFRIYSWSATGSRPLFVEKCILGLEEIIRHLVSEAEKLPGQVDDQVRLRFEFFLPLPYLSEAVDQLQYEDIFGERLKLGSTYQVVVRCLDRAQHPKGQPAWFERWRKYRDCVTQAAAPAVSRVLRAAGDVQPNILDELQSAADVACVGLAFAVDCQPPDMTHLKQLLSAGTPVALWARHCEEVGSSAHVHQRVETLVQSPNLTELPFLVRHERRQAITPAHPGNYLTLLWDDPERIPPDLYPSTITRLQAP